MNASVHDGLHGGVSYERSVVTHIDTFFAARR
jgi:hypothetical protein